MKDIFYVKWDFGFHKRFIETTKDDMIAVIDNMSTEFEIEKNKKSVSTGDGDSMEMTEYCIVNYYGELYVFAMSYERVQ